MRRIVQGWPLPRRPLGHSRMLVPFEEAALKMDTTILRPGLARRLRELGASERADTLAAYVWLPNEQLDNFLVRRARRLLESHGDVAYLVPDHDNPGEEILRWRWMSLALPPDLLVAAADRYGSSFRVQLLDPTLHILQPTAHLHVHATAVVPFTRIWTGIGETMDLQQGVLISGGVLKAGRVAGMAAPRIRSTAHS